MFSEDGISPATSRALVSYVGLRLTFHERGPSMWGLAVKHWCPGEQEGPEMALQVSSLPQHLFPGNEQVSTQERVERGVPQ